MKNFPVSHFRTEIKARRKKQARCALRAAIKGSAAENAGSVTAANLAKSARLGALKSGALSANTAAAAASAGDSAKAAALSPAAGKTGLKKRRGRPRIAGKLREPNGRISRAQRPAALPATQARAFHTGLTLEQAKDPRAATYLGRLAIFGRGEGLSADQYQAAQDFLTLRNDYRRALLSPGAYYEETGIRLGGDNMAEYSAWVERVKKRYAGALRAVQEAQMDNGRENIYAALQYVIIDGRELPYMLGAVRLALNALRRHFSRASGSRRKSSRLDSISLAGLTSLNS